MEINPLRQYSHRMRRSPEPSSMVIFGGSGDLTRRKLIPALFRLSQQRMIPAGFAIIGLARSSMSDNQYRDTLRTWVEKESGSALDPEHWNAFAQGIHYMTADYHNPSIYGGLKEMLINNDEARRTAGNRIYYLATPPSDYAHIIGNLGQNGMGSEFTAGIGWVRIIIEKPFGRDLRSAQELNKVVSSVFREDQVYRIDHYLGKETVQNILVL